MTTTVTGIAVPSLDARIAGRLGLRPDVRRVPLFGLGCVGGAAGIARVHDYLRGAPDRIAALVSVELCSLTYPAGPEVLDSRSRMYPDSLDTMGWKVGRDGFHLILSPKLPELIDRYLADDMDGFLGDHDLAVGDIATWVSHPGGPKVLEAIAAALDIGDDALELSWRSLAEVGNLSSSSVLHVLRDTIAKKPAAGQPGLLMAMGPGFCTELVLLRWR